MFGYDGLDLDNLRDPCVMDFTEEFSTKLCYVENCKSPTLDLLGLETNPSCSADKTTNLGKWQIYYSCEFQSKDSSTSTENQTVLEENGISNEVNIYHENISKNEPLKDNEILEIQGKKILFNDDDNLISMTSENYKYVDSNDPTTDKVKNYFNKYEEKVVAEEMDENETVSIPKIVTTTTTTTTLTKTPTKHTATTIIDLRFDENSFYNDVLTSEYIVDVEEVVKDVSGTVTDNSENYSNKFPEDKDKVITGDYMVDVNEVEDRVRNSVP